ncbi:polysaccharide deacetylase [Halarcobacter mediterraneus]|uniref:Polysaccharide deacetylase n=2 Tax=Halarcobacter mediterraneus TaxID=2023153 RepID=A0A4Q1AWF1_9BACT|nr:polysaccharide deacetylase [Halarcobacter mediterraneus]
MYHHVNSDRCSNDLEIFEKHIKYISENFKTTFPTDEKLKGNYACLIFDDAYVDFYYLIFPILKKYKVKALLAVPTKYILNSCENDTSLRMSFEHNDEFKNYEKGTFCTFEEMKEMIASNLVQIVSHSHTHTNLLEENIDLDQELNLSKKILEDKLNIKVETFVYPFGKFNKEIAQQTHKVYKYSFRIGNAIHKDFSGIKGINYRVNADGLKTADEIFKFPKILKYKFKALIKSF